MNAKIALEVVIQLAFANGVNQYQSASHLYVGIASTFWERAFPDRKFPQHAMKEPDGSTRNDWRKAVEILDKEAMEYLVRKLDGDKT
jgi:hypothetical protein